MKTFFAILAVCLVAANSAVVPEQPPTNYELLVEDILHEMANIALHTAEVLEHQFEEIILDPLHQVEEAVDSIEDRREIDESCVAAEEYAVSAAVDAMHDEMNACGIVAAKTSAGIMNDINEATQQLVFGGYDVLSTYKKCKNYKNIVMKNSCYARLSIKGGLYLKNSRKSIKTIRKSTSEDVPAVFVDADSCTHTAANKAIVEIELVHTKIDACDADRQ